MNRDELIARELTSKPSLSVNLTPDNIKDKIPKLQKLQVLLQHYQALKRHQQTLDEHSKTIERHKEMEQFLKEWRYNKDNPEPDVDLGNGKVRITVWKDAPEDNDKK
jgi:hypothetical protein